MAKNKSKLNLLLEEIMREDNPAPMPQNIADIAEPETELEHSLDAAVDAYIIRYEKESIPTSETYEDELFNEPQMTYESILEYVMLEADEEEDSPADEGGEDLSGGLLGDQEAEAPAPGGESGAGGAVPKPIMNTPQINLQDFARSIARLVNNYDTLLSPKNIILNRVQKYIEMNYDVKTAKELMDILDVNYSLTTDNNAEKEWPTPYTVGALSTEG